MRRTFLNWAIAILTFLILPNILVKEEFLDYTSEKKHGRQKLNLILIWAFTFVTNKLSIFLPENTLKQFHTFALFCKTFFLNEQL